jgi:cyclase
VKTWEFSKGLHDLGNGAYAYLQPDGTWGWSNAGLLVDGDVTLLVDTLFDLRLTADMLATMRAAVPAARTIDTLVNTHGNPDHVFGNELVSGATIIASAAAAEEIRGMNPQRMQSMETNWENLGDAGWFYHDTMGPKFDFSNVTVTPPTQTFEKRLDMTVGSKVVQLYNVGPAHTSGDTIVYVPSERIVFTGDILFNNGHPIVWAGPVANWVAACDLLLGLDVDVVVPGHGPIADKRAVHELKAYLGFISTEARRHFDDGLNYEAAARKIDLSAFGTWSDPERIVANVASMYREFSADERALDVSELFAAMGRYRKEHRHTHAGA